MKLIHGLWYHNNKCINKFIFYHKLNNDNFVFTALVAKETEFEETSRARSAESIKSSADAERAVSSKIVGLESQLEIWKGEVMAKDIELNQLHEKYTECLHNENLNQQEINKLKNTVAQLNAKKNSMMLDVAVQKGI